MNNIKNIINSSYNEFSNLIMKKRLKNKDFSIISNNCWGSQVYQDLKIEYTTPFVGLFIFAPCYIKLLKNLDYYLNKRPEFISHLESKYKNLANNYYPIGILDDIEIHFLHYKDQEEALEKWTRRLIRLNRDNLFIKFCDRDLCTEQLITEFDNLDFQHKVCFTANKFDLEPCIWFRGYSGQPYVDNEMTVYKRYFDVVSWLNSETKSLLKR